MDYARDKYTGKDIKAEEFDGGNLICPTCNKSVHYVNGYKSPYFSHYKGGTPECENYHPTNHISNSTASFLSDSNQPTENTNYSSFHLDIILSKATLKTPSWHLAIVFANKSTTQGSFIIKQGLMGEIHASFSTQTKPIPVVTQNQDYQIEISDNADFNNQTVSGLVIKTGNIFTHKGDYGRSLSSQKHLYWGEQYFLVWHKNYNIECPPEIMQRALLSQENWNCVEIQLPNNPNADIIAWAEQYLSKKILLPAITLSLVTPPIYKNDEDIQIKATDKVVIAVTEPLGNFIRETLVIKSENFRQKEMDVNGSSPVLIDLGPLRLGKTTLRLNSPRKLLVLNCIQFPNSLMLPSAVFLTFQDGFKADAYSLKIRECLQIKNNPLKNIEFPVAMPFCIQTKYQHFFVKPQNSESLEEFQNRALQEINKILETEKGLVQLDFGDFGQALLREELTVVKSECTLSKKSVQQIQWLANLGGQQASGEGMRMLQKLSHGELKKYLKQINHLPAIAEPYLRTLAIKLKKEQLKNEF